MFSGKNINIDTTYIVLLAFAQDPGGFRELRGPCTIQFRQSRYLSDCMVPSHGPNIRGNVIFRLPYIKQDRRTCRKIISSKHINS